MSPDHKDQSVLLDLPVRQVLPVLSVPQALRALLVQPVPQALRALLVQPVQEEPLPEVNIFA
jgi:hypothetical protein